MGARGSHGHGVSVAMFGLGSRLLVVDCCQFVCKYRVKGIKMYAPWGKNFTQSFALSPSAPTCRCPMAGIPRPTSTPGAAATGDKKPAHPSTHGRWAHAPRPQVTRTAAGGRVTTGRGPLAKATPRRPMRMALPQPGAAMAPPVGPHSAQTKTICAQIKCFLREKLKPSASEELLRSPNAACPKKHSTSLFPRADTQIIHGAGRQCHG